MQLSVIGNYEDLLKFHFIIALSFSWDQSTFPKTLFSQSYKNPFTFEFSKQFISYKIELFFQVIAIHSSNYTRSLSIAIVIQKWSKW